MYGFQPNSSASQKPEVESYKNVLQKFSCIDAAEVQLNAIVQKNKPTWSHDHFILIEYNPFDFISVTG